MKITALFMALIAAIQAFFGIAPKPPVIGPDHEHVYEAQTVAPTCTEEGCVLYLCVCGESYEESVVPAKGHNWSAWNTSIKENTLFRGIQKRTCSTCKAKEKRYIPKLIKDHTHEYIEGIIEPTCTSEGKHTFTCNCGAAYDESIGKLPHDYVANVIEPTCVLGGCTIHTCSVCEKTYTDTRKDALGHSMSNWRKTIDETCTHEGEVTRHCNRCDYVEVDILPMRGHTRVIDEAVAPTCTEYGYEQGSHCSVCGEITHRQIRINPLGHNYGEWVVTIPATCMTNGRKTRTCTRCNATETEVIPYGHVMVEDGKIEATCTQPGMTGYVHCKNCDYSESDNEVIPALGHSYAERVVPPTCTEDGYTLHICTRCQDRYTDNVVPSSGNGHNCTEHIKISCETCGMVLVEDITREDYLDSDLLYETLSTTHGNGRGAAHQLSIKRDYTMICDDCGQTICEHNSREDIDNNPNITYIWDEYPVCGNWGHAYYQCSKCGRQEIMNHGKEPKAAHHYVTMTAPEAYAEAYANGAIPTREQIEKYKNCSSLEFELRKIQGRSQAINFCEYRYKDAERMIALQNISDDYIVEICERCHHINVHSLRLQRDEIERIAQANQILTLVNNFRAQNGKSALVLDDYLCKLAYARSRELAELGYAHLHDIPGNTAGNFGENIVFGPYINNNLQKEFDAWKNSEGHRANMLYSYKTFAYSSHVESTSNIAFGVQLFSITSKNDTPWFDQYANNTLSEVSGYQNAVQMYYYYPW